MVENNPVPDGEAYRQITAIGMLLGALVLVIAAGVVFWWPASDGEAPQPANPAAPHTAQPTSAAVEIVPTTSPTPPPTLPPQPTIPPLDWTHPTAAAAEVNAALDQPIAERGEAQAVARALNPLTIQPARARDGVITYTVVSGDNLQSIAERFGVSESTIIWSNARFYVNAMRIGMELTILPVDGVYHRTEEPQTIAAIADQYSVNPFAIIDSEFNTLFGTTPDTVLPEGLYVVVPGGQGNTEPVYWDPGIEMASTSGGASASSGYASFGAGDPGSCGRQPVQSGSPPYSPPIWASYSITQDYTWNHGGIDLAVPPGTSVYAAGGGTVVFAGWSSWGYGYAVVLAHGSTMSIYGHLNGPLVSCGQVVQAGEGIAVTGSTGRSSGPHLHFEIRGSDGKPVNPWNYQSF